MTKALSSYFCLTLISYLASTSIAEASHFPKEIIILGDSLSDQGNAPPADAAIIAPNVVTRESPITDGTTWPVYLAAKIGAQLPLPFIQGGTNFAYVGAQTKGFPSPFYLVPSLTTQEQSLLAKNTSRRTPVFIFGGANDIFFVPTPGPGDTAAINIGNILDNLHHKHFKTLIVLNLPNIGKIPSAGANAASYTTNSLLFNSVLQQELKNKNYPVIAIDLFNVFEELFANPESFGLKNATGFPKSAPTSGDPTAGFVFWYDGTHPTEATHRLIADYLFSILSAPECYATLAEVPFGVMREQRTTIHQQLVPDQPVHEKSLFYPFVSGSYTPLLIPPMSDSCDDHDIDGGDVTAGFTNRITDSWTVGAAGSYAKTFSKCHEQNNKCEFDLKAGILSVFAGYQKEHGYVNGIFNVAWLNYDDVKRKFFVGPRKEQTHADTKGKDYDAEIYGAYYIWAYPHFKTGPLLDMNYQRLFVEGYKESGAAFGNIRYRGQNNSLFATGLGWEALINYDAWGTNIVTDLFLTANRQWLGKKRYIHFNERSLPGTHGTWPVKAHRNTYASGGINFSTLFKNRLIFSLGYTFNVGTFEMSEHSLTAGLTLPLGKKKAE